MAKRFKKKKVSQGPETIAKDKIAPQMPSWLKRDWVLGLVLFLAVILVYQPVWYAGFIWDDDYHVTANPCIIGPLGLKDIWLSSEWRPFVLVITAFWFEHALWGLEPLPYHLINIFEEAVCAILVWRILVKLRVPGAWLGAALWALHPLQVESVAWISEMKNTQSCFFYLLTILFFLRWLETDAKTHWYNWNYGLAVLCAALAMASKSSTVVLPAVLGLCAWWMEGKWRWRNLVLVAPIIFLSLISCAIIIWPHAADPGVTADPQFARSWPDRVATAGYVTWFYLGKLLWPYPLITIYPRWKIDGSQLVSFLPLLVVVIVSFILWFKRKSWLRPCFFAWAYFLIVLSPFLGLIEQSFWIYSFVEDHLQYLAGMGPLALIGAGLTKFLPLIRGENSWLPSIVCAGILTVLGALSWQQSWFYENEESLWNHTLAINPNCWVGYNNLGLALYSKGQIDQAIVQYQKALEINPSDAMAHDNLGSVLLQKGQVDKAIAQFQRALELSPIYAAARYNWGFALTKKGYLDDAIVQYKKALEIDPAYAEAHDNLGNALIKKGQIDEGIVQYQKALEISPTYAEAHYNLGFALLKKGNLDGAIAQYEKAVEIDPNYADAHNNLGNVFLQKGQLDEAIVQYEKVLKIRPDDVQANNNLNVALYLKTKRSE